MNRTASVLAVVATTLGVGAAHAADCNGPLPDNVWNQRVWNSVVHVEVEPSDEGLAGHGVVVRNGSSLQLLAPLHLFIAKGRRQGREYFLPNRWIARSVRVAPFKRADPRAKAVFREALNQPVSTAFTRRMQRPDLDLVLFELPFALTEPRLQDVDLGIELRSDPLGSSDKVCGAWFIGRDDTGPMYIERAREPLGSTFAPYRIAWMPTTNNMNMHLSGAPLFDENGRIVAVTQYRDTIGYVATLTRDLKSQASLGGTPFLSRVSAGSFVGSARAVSRHEAATAPCSALTGLNDRLDELTQAGLDYQEREVVLAFPSSYVDYITNVENSLSSAVRAASTDAACGCTPGLDVTVSAVAHAAKVQRRMNAVAEFRRLTMEALFFPGRHRRARVTPNTSIDAFCADLDWIVLPQVGVRISPLERLLICGIGRSSRMPTVGEVTIPLFGQRVSQTDICPALPELNARLGWQLSCPAAANTWNTIANRVAPDLVWMDLARTDRWKQVLLWKGAVREGLVAGSSKLVGLLSRVSADALDQDAGIPVDIGATMAALNALPLGGPATPAVVALNDFNQRLGSLRPELAEPFAAKVRTSSELFDAVVLALPDSEPSDGSGQRFPDASTYVEHLDGAMRDLQGSLARFVDAVARDLQTQCVGVQGTTRTNATNGSGN